MGFKTTVLGYFRLLSSSKRAPTTALGPLIHWKVWSLSIFRLSWLPIHLVLKTLLVGYSDYVRISGQIVDCERIDWIATLLGLLMDTDCAGAAKPCLSWLWPMRGNETFASTRCILSSYWSQRKWVDSTIILREVACLELLRTAFRSLFVLRTGQRVCENWQEAKLNYPFAILKGSLISCRK